MSRGYRSYHRQHPEVSLAFLLLLIILFSLRIVLFLVLCYLYYFISRRYFSLFYTYFWYLYLCYLFLFFCLYFFLFLYFLLLIYVPYRIITPERLGDVFNQEEIKLRYTPRKMLLHPTTNYIITLETDHNTSPATIYGGLRGKILEAQHQGATGAPSASSEEVKQERMEEDEHEGKEKHTEKGKEDPVKELERLQREQATREEYERMYGAPKPGNKKTPTSHSSPTTPL